jgi:phage tail protein X
MARKFRVTCARTSYFEVELEAEDWRAAEAALSAAIETNPGLAESGFPLGKSICRIVDIEDAAAEMAAREKAARAA